MIAQRCTTVVDIVVHCCHIIVQPLLCLFMTLCSFFPSSGKEVMLEHITPYKCVRNSHVLKGVVDSLPLRGVVESLPRGE